jgi:hypothetical protein
MSIETSGDYIYIILSEREKLQLQVDAFVIWDAASSGPVDRYRRFGVTCFLHVTLMQRLAENKKNHVG